MAFTLDPQTGKITFGAVADLTHDAISRDIASEFGVSETFNDNFVTDKFTDVGTGVSVNTNSQVIDWVSQNIVGDNGSYVDLESVSDTEWVLRFKLNFSTLTLGAPSANFYVGMSDDNVTMAGAGTQDMISFHVHYHNSTQKFGAFDTDNATVPKGDGNDFDVDGVPLTGTDYYVELRRTSGTGYDLTLFSDRDYTVVIATGSGTCSANTVGLRYLKVAEHSGVGGAFMEGSINDVQFWDGITVPVITSNNWRMRFKLDITDLDISSGADLSLWVGMMSEDATSDSTNLQDGFQLGVFVDNILNKFVVNTPNNQAPRSSGIDQTMTTLPSENTFFIEMKRDSETETTVSFYTDETFTATSEVKTGITGITGTSGLKYLKLFNDVLGNNANTMDGTFDDFTFTDLTDEVAGVEEETFLVDAFIQALGDNGCAIIFSDNFATSTNWTQTGSQVTIASGEIQGWGADATAQRVTHDLVTPLNDDQWTTEFEFEFSAENNTAHDILVLTDTDTVSSTLQDHIVCRFGSSNNPVFALLHGGNSAIGAGSAIAGDASINTRYFVRLQRLSSEVARLTVFTTGFDQALFGTVDVDLTLFGGTPTGLRYVISETSDLGGSGRTLTGIIDNLSIKGCRTFTADAFVQELDQEETFIVDALLQAQGGLCGISLANLKAYWTFDETSGVLVNQATSIGSVDSLGTSADGTVGGEIDRQITGQVSDSYDFEGATETQAGNRITIGSSDSQFNFMHTPNGEGTFNFWINPTGGVNSDIFIDQNNSGANTGFNIQLTAEDKINTRFRNGSTQDLLSTFNSVVTLSTGVFTMVTVVWDETTGADVYFNGVLIASHVRNGNTASSSDADHPLTIGTRTDAQASVTYDGLLDEATAWDRKLTANEIAILYDLNNAGNAIQEGNQATCVFVDALLQSLGDGGSCTSSIYTDDMSSATSWISSDTTPPGFADITGGVLAWEGLADGSNDTIATDLTLPSRVGKVLDDTSFRVRFKQSYGSVGLLTHFNHEFFHVSDSDHTVNAGTGSEDAIGFHVQIGGGSPTQVVIPFYKNGSSTKVQAVGTLHTISTGSTFFYEIIRNSATSVTWNVYSDPLYTALVSTLTDSAVPASVGGLKYFKGGNWAFGNIANLLLGSVDDLEILTIGTTGNVGCADVDAILLVVTIDKTFDVDAILVNRIDKTFLVDTFSEAVQTETFDINAILKATQTFNFTIDGLLSITPSELYCVDALIQDTFDEDFTVDVRLSALEEFTVDASIVRNKFFTLDAFPQAISDEEFLIDSRVVLRIEKTFLVDAFTQEAPQIPVEFFIDAIIRYAQGSAVGEFGAIPDLIIRVLRENGTLTGRGIVDEIVIITTAEDFPFRGKNSRIKNWLNRLRLDGLIQEDGSSPDWYKTIWSLV